MHGWSLTSFALAWMVMMSSIGMDRCAAKAALEVEDALMTRRVMRNLQQRNDHNPQGAVSISPDRRRYVMRVIQADVVANGVQLELYAGEMGSIHRTAAARLIARLFTSGLGDGGSNFGPAEDLDGFSNEVRWVDAAHVAFLWSNARGLRQVVRVNVVSGQVEFLTAHPAHVANFAITSQGVLYNAQARPRTAVRTLEGMMVPATADAWTVFHGDWARGTALDFAQNSEWFIRKAGESARVIEFDARVEQRDWQTEICASPDGREALVDVPALTVLPSWDRYPGALGASIVQLRRDPSEAMARNVHRLQVVDMNTARARPLWDAPTLVARTRCAWSPSGRSVLLVGSYLPPGDAESRARDGDATVVVDVHTGAYVVLPLVVRGRDVASIEWLSESELRVHIRGDTGITARALFFRRGRWSIAREPIKPRVNGTRFEIRESLNTPPRVFVTDAKGQRARLLMDLNPQLEGIAVGDRERRQGRLASGEAWHAILFHPRRYDARPVPLVIQSVYGKGELSDEFTLYGFQEGAGLGPTLIAAYPGQVLAAKGIAVLHLNVVSPPGTTSTPEEAPLRMRAFEHVATELAKQGLIDPARVALLGFSRNGYYVEYAITHSDFPFAAAVSADNWDPGYFQQTLMGYGASADAVNGGIAFGDTLQEWLANAPAFNAHRVRTPLLMIEQSLGRFGVLARWELYSRLRYLGRPVEFYMVPNADRGTHVTQNPEQILSTQRAVVGWLERWLKLQSQAGERSVGHAVP